MTFSSSLPPSHATARSDGVTLPLDILQEVFRCGSHYLPLQERMEFMLLVASVSRTWRSAALENSSLWSTILINYSVTRHSGNQIALDTPYIDLLRRVKLFLKRSRYAPLDIYIKFLTSNRDKAHGPHLHYATSALGRDARSTVTHLALVLAPHIRRFRRFHILSTRYNPVKELLESLPQVRMPQFEELHIDRVRRTQYSQLHSDSPKTCKRPMAFLNIHTEDQFGTNFPALRSVALSAVPSLLPRFIPKCLTSLKLTLPGIEFTAELRNLLVTNSSTLENLSFMTAHPSSLLQPQGPFDSKGPISLPFVTKLSLSYANPNMLISLLSTLQLDNVVKLKIENMRRDTSHATDRFFQALRQTVDFGRLEELTIDNIFKEHNQHQQPPRKNCNIVEPLTAVYPYCVISLLHSLRVLKIDNVDQNILRFLNIGKVLSRQEMTVFPLPRLTHLLLAPIGTASDLENIHDFLVNRSKMRSDNAACAAPNLKELTIVGPKMWSHYLCRMDLASVAGRVRLVSPSIATQSTGIWDEELSYDQTCCVDLSLDMSV